MLRVVLSGAMKCSLLNQLSYPCFWSATLKSIMGRYTVDYDHIVATETSYQSQYCISEYAITLLLFKKHNGKIHSGLRPYSGNRNKLPVAILHFRICSLRLKTWKQLSLPHKASDFHFLCKSLSQWICNVNWVRDGPHTVCTKFDQFCCKFNSAWSH